MERKIKLVIVCILLVCLANAAISQSHALEAEKMGNSFCSQISISRNPSDEVVVSAFYSTLGNSLLLDPIGWQANSWTGTGSLVCKYASDGELYWYHEFTGQNPTILASTADMLGNVYVVGAFSGSFDFDPSGGSTILNGGAGSSFLIKYDPTGTLLWARQFCEVLHHTTPTRPLARIAANQFGEVFVKVMFAVASDFDPGPGSLTFTPLGGYDIGITKYDAAGNWLDAYHIGGTGTLDNFGDMEIAKDGGFFLSFGLSGMIDVDPTAGVSQLAAVSGVDHALVRYRRDGSLHWAWVSGLSSVTEESYDLAQDPGGNIYIAWDSGNACVTRIDSFGLHQWTKSWAGRGPMAVVVTSQGEPIVASNRPSNGQYSKFTRLDPAGTIVKSTSFGGWPYLQDIVMSMDSLENFFVQGVFQPPSQMSIWPFNIKPFPEISNIYGDTVNFYCPSSWIGIYNRAGNAMSGKAFYDRNGNGVQSLGEQDLSGIVFSASPFGGTAISDYNGSYTCRASSTITTIAPQGLPGHFNAYAPLSYSFNFAGLQDSTVGGHVFAMTMPQGIVDAGVSLVAPPSGRPGSTVYYDAIVRNSGSVNVSGDITLYLPPVVTLVATSPLTSSIIGNTVTWSFNNLASFETRHFTCSVTLDTTLQNGQSFSILASISLLQPDVNPIDNHSSTTTWISTSFDPNDKTVSKERIYAHEIDSGAYLDYVIHFQNTGNDTAFKVRIMDTIPSTLRIGTIEMLGGSHPWSMTLTASNVIQWTFPGIELPDSSTNQLGSQGYICFRIKPAQNLMPHTFIENAASIYFDFNLPVITNTAITEVRRLLVNTASTSPPCYGTDDGIIDVTILGGTSPFLYSLDGQNFVPTPIFTGLASGTYVVQVLDSMGFGELSDPIVLSSPPIFLLDSISVVAMPPNQSNVSIFATGGTPPLRYGLGPNGPQQSPIFLSIGPGTYLAYVEDSLGCNLNDTLYVPSVVGVGTAEILGFTLSPTPASEYVELFIGTATDDPFQVQVTDLHGRILKDLRHDFGKQPVLRLSCADFSPGVYVVSVRFGPSQIDLRRTIVIQH